jgi:hypothetical protein
MMSLLPGGSMRGSSRVQLEQISGLLIVNLPFVIPFCRI